MMSSKTPKQINKSRINSKLIRIFSPTRKNQIQSMLKSEPAQRSDPRADQFLLGFHLQEGDL